MPKFRYAYDQNNRLVDVFELPQDHSELVGEFVCVGCGARLIAKTKGEKREKHFCHFDRVMCGEETYLHKLAKSVFWQVYSQCLDDNEPFFVELKHPKVCSKFEQLLGHSCPVGALAKAHDLTRYYNKIKREQRDGVFVPDVKIYDAADESKGIWIEIAVTHFISDKKRESDSRIIEIPIESETDIDVIRSRKLTEATASFINFYPQPAPVTDAECLCANELFYCLFLHKSGKTHLEGGLLGQIKSKLDRRSGDSGNIIHIARALDPLDPTEPARLYVNGLHEAMIRGIALKNCFLCKYSGVPSVHSTDPIFCKIKKYHCGSNEAVGCPSFRVGMDWTALAGTEFN